MAQVIWRKDFTGYKYIPVVWTAEKDNKAAKILLNCWYGEDKAEYEVDMFIDNRNITMDNPNTVEEYIFASLEEAKEYAEQYLR